MFVAGFLLLLLFFPSSVRCMDGEPDPTYAAAMAGRFVTSGELAQPVRALLNPGQNQLLVLAARGSGLALYSVAEPDGTSQILNDNGVLVIPDILANAGRLWELAW